ncbi:hypothetical protein [Desulfospira joergensenii]|uniref:hypothetical protein n=1 Tax=Desulfospira joergensenii TaxID=53329 RepID=UPI0003B6BC45|nr:hypothetical protein [Desulfospira joergensenii]
MFGLDMLDVMVGLITIYLSFGIACTSMVEAVSSVLGLRSKNLQKGMDEFFQGDLSVGKNNKAFIDAFYEHPMIQTLSRGAKGRPSYIPTEMIGQVVESILNRNGSFQNLKEGLDTMPGEPGKNRIKDLLLVFHDQSKGDLYRFKKKVEIHFDESMERAAGWFKRKTQYIAIGFSTVLVILGNIDTIDIVRHLSVNPESRTALVESADRLLEERKNRETEIVESSDSDETLKERAEEKTEEARKTYARAVSNLEKSGLKLGWNRIPRGWGEWMSKITGLLISALSVSLGAPFWFQVLQRFMQVRGSGGKKGK